MSFRISVSQKSNASNGVPIGVETKKLWSFEDNRAKLSENFAAQSPFRSCEMSCEMKSTCEISQGVSQLRNHLQAHVCHFASWNSIFAAANHVAKSPPSCESSCKSSPSWGITSKLLNHKFNLQNQSSNLQNGQFNVRNPPVQSQIFATDSVRFFLKIFCVNFYFLLVISQRYYWDIS